MGIEEFITDWETNEKLTLRQRETYQHLEDVYLREKHPKKDKFVDYDMKIKKSQYILIGDNLWEVLGELGELTLLTRANRKLTVVTSSIVKEEGKLIWKYSL